MTMKIARALHKRTKEEKGFTLIELIVVIAVLGVLATLIIPRVVGVQNKAKEAAITANEKIIKNALERYYAEHGEYPEEQTIEEGKQVTWKDKLAPYVEDIPEGFTYERESKDVYVLTPPSTTSEE